MDGIIFNNQKVALTENDRQILETCLTYFSCFSTFLNKFQDLYSQMDDILLDKLFQQTIDSLGEIFSSKIFIKNCIKFQSQHFGMKMNVIQFCSNILANIIDMPGIFSRDVRCTAIRQIGKAVSRIGHIKHIKFQKLVIITIKSFQLKLYSFHK